MIATQHQVRLAAQLYQARDDVRTILGDRFKQRMAEYGAVIKSVAAAQSTPSCWAMTRP